MASDPTRATWLLAVDPVGLGGAWLRGPAGEARDAWLANLRHALPPDTPWRRVPLHIDDERLLGGMDLAASLAAGRPVREAGLIAQAAGGLLLLPMAERASAGLAARLALALDTGADIALLALDEGLPPDEALAPVLAERLALVVAPNSVEPLTPPPFDLADVRLALTQIPFDGDAVQALCHAAQALGITSLRPAWQAWRVACVAAACAGHATVEQEDAELAARLVLSPRARTLPAPPAAPEASQQPDPPAPPQDGAPDAPAEPPVEPVTEPSADPSADAPLDAPTADRPASTTPATPAQATAPLADQMLHAAAAAIPPGLLAALAGASGRRPVSNAGRSGAAAAATSGRAIGARRGLPRGQARLDLLATLRAAVPWQRLRVCERAQAGLPPSAARLLLQRDDFHVRRHQSPLQTTTVFVVDASGSQAVQRLAEAKGAVELLLADCYVRRDQVTDRLSW